MSATSTTSTIKPIVNKDVQVSKTSQTTEYEKSLRIVLGTVFGVFGVLGILIIVYLIYRFCKNRNRSSRSGSSDRNPSLHRSVSVDLEQKQVPTVLLLYSYDCSAHEKVVESLAGFLIETCNCSVHLDMFEEQLIMERGLDEWLVDNLQEAEFIIVLSSVGARLRCSKKKVRFKLEDGKILPDYFAVAVDYVAEKMRVERSKGMPLTTFCVAYMDYSTESDIPPQLEMAFKFCLMKDITALFCHLHGIRGEPTKDGAPIPGLTPETFDTTEMGQELRVAIESAKEYFKSNPDWVEDRIEPVPNPGKKSRHNRKNSLEPLLMPSQEDQSLPPLKSHIISTEITVQPLPKITPHSQQMPLISSQNRQNSYPSSLSSRQTLSTPPLNKSSKSCDNFPKEADSRCDLCGLKGHSIGSSDCNIKQFMPTQESENDDSVKLKSKSMPAVNRNSLFSSQTIFQAEVHKEWDDQDGRLSQADSHETSSNHESVVDDLERDLDSIVNPTHISRPSFYNSGYDNLRSAYSKLNFPARMENISEIGSKKPLFTDIQAFVEPDFDQSDAVALNFLSHDKNCNEVVQIQLEDIKL